jgi:DNA polymerase-3 subunit alpha
MAKLRLDFVRGGVAKGFKEAQMTELFKIIERSSNYAFNKSHAIAYTLSSYYSMWFKVHHPVEWATAELSVQVEDTKKLHRYLFDAMRSGIRVLPPDINKSEWGFCKEGNAIRCGLGMVKRFSSKGYDELEAQRKRAAFTSFSDFLARVSGKKVNRGAVEALVKAGAFDSFKQGRKPLIDLMEYYKRHKNPPTNFAATLKDWNSVERAREEREVLGFYISGHPILKFRAKLEEQGIDLSTGTGSSRTSGTIRIAGIIDKIKEWNSRRGKMAFVEITGMADFSLCVWSTTWQEYRDVLHEGEIVIATVRRLEDGEKYGVDSEKGDGFDVIGKVN